MGFLHRLIMGIWLIYDFTKTLLLPQSIMPNILSCYFSLVTDLYVKHWWKWPQPMLDDSLYAIKSVFYANK